MKVKKALLLSVLAFGMTFGVTNAETSGKWTETENNALVFIENGVVQKNTWVKYNNKWYYVDYNGNKVVNQWIKDSQNRWYFLTEDGSRVENGFYFIKSRKLYAYFKDGVSVENQWIQENGRWYFLDKNGYMKQNEWLQNSKGQWLYVGKSGARIEHGFYYIPSSDKKSYFKDGISVENQWVEENGKMYFLDKSGYMKTNEWLQNSRGQWLYVGKDGARVENGFYHIPSRDLKAYFRNGISVENEWVQANGKWYFLGKDGYMKINEWIQNSSGQWLYVGKDGSRVENGFYYIESRDKKSYFKNGISVENEWIKVNGKWYFIDKSGYLKTEEWLQNSKGQWLYVGKDGARIENGFYNIASRNMKAYFKNGISVENEWVQLGGKSYYLGKDGYLRTSQWIPTTNGGWSYVDENGIRVENKVIEVNGKSYYIDKNGQQFYGKEFDFEGKRYYFNSNGEITKSVLIEKLVDSSNVADIKYIEVSGGYWKTNGGAKQYVDANGNLLKSVSARINGKIYYFKSDGTLRVNQWVEKNEKYYFIGEDGAVKTGFARDDKGIMRYFSIVDGEMITNIFAYDKSTETGYNIDKYGVGRKSNNPRQDFIEMVKPYVLRVVKDKGLFPSVAVAQIALETGYGRSTLGYPPVYNLFGIKAPDGAPESEYIAVWTTEYDSNNQPYDIIDKFKKFKGYEDAFNYYASLFTRNAWLTKWYKPVIDAKTPEEAANALTGRYATDPNYGKKLLQIIELFNLKELDKQIYPNGVKP